MTGGCSIELEAPFVLSTLVHNGGGRPWRGCYDQILEVLRVYQRGSYLKAQFGGQGTLCLVRGQASGKMQF